MQYTKNQAIINSEIALNQSHTNTRGKRTLNKDGNYFIHDLDCGKGCLDCGARMNRAKSIPEMLCMLRYYRKKHGFKYTLENIRKISKGYEL